MPRTCSAAAERFEQRGPTGVSAAAVGRGSGRAARDWLARTANALFPLALLLVPVWRAFEHTPAGLPADLRWAIPVTASAILAVDQLHRLLRRKSRWPRWFMLFVLASAWFAFGTSGMIAAASFLIACVALMTMLVPPALRGVDVALDLALRRQSDAERSRCASTLYAAAVLVLLFSPVWAPTEARRALTESLEPIAIAWALLTALCTYRYRGLLWQRRRTQLLGTLLPHVSAWIWIVYWTVVVSYDGALDLDRAWAFKIALWASLTVPVAFVYQVAKSSLQPLVANADGPEPRGARSRTRSSGVYVEVDGHARRLESMVESSEGGVFAITGLRGAGKSALARYLLDGVRGRYFVHEISAPSRFEPNLGFLVALCRGVCAQVLDDFAARIEQAGHSALGTSVMRLRLLAPLLVVLAAVGAFAYAVMPAYLVDVYRSIAEVRAGMQTRVPPDTQRRVLEQIQREREVVTALLRQTDAALAERDTAPGAGSRHYLLVPGRAGGRPRLLPQGAGPDVTTERTRHDLAKYQTASAQGEEASEAGLPGAAGRTGGAGEAGQPFEAGEAGEAGQRSNGPGAPSLRDSPEQLVLGRLGIRASLAVLGPRIRAELFAGPDSPRDAGGLLTDWIDAAFDHAHPRLSFDENRLARFGDLLESYLDVLGGPPEAPLPRPFPARALLAAVLAVLVLMLLWPAVRGASIFARWVANHRLHPLYVEAVTFAERLAYHDSREQGVALALKVMSLGRRRTLASRDLTMAELTSRYAALLGVVAEHYNGKVIIVIDELDKVQDPGEVADLLAEIKGAICLPGTYCLVTISEDAARCFHRRLSGQRDIFESTFDDVIEVERLDVRQGTAMLAGIERARGHRQRVAEACLAVLVVAGGGIPREIIRAHRALLEVRDRDGAPDVLARSQPARAATRILRNEVRTWAAHIVDVDAARADAVALRACAFACNELVARTDPEPDALSELWSGLSRALELIDPEEARSRPSFGREPIGAGPAAAGDAAPAVAHATDVQTCLRLMAITLMAEIIASGEGPWEQYSGELLECYATIAERPGLAETLLLDLRRAALGPLRPVRPGVVASA